MRDQAPNQERNWPNDIPLPRFSDLRERRLVDERMDNPDIDPQQHINALKGIHRINVFSAAARTLWPILYKRAQKKPIRVLDLACGGGDVAIALANRAQRMNLPITIEGCDISDTATRFAVDRAERMRANVKFFQHDAIHCDLPPDYDAVYSSLFVHHLSTANVKKLLSGMTAAAPVVIINDLVRSAPGLLLAYVGCHALSRSPVVHFDGPSSVAAAFTISEFRTIANEAGLSECTISWKWPFRFLFTYERAGAP